MRIVGHWNYWVLIGSGALVWATGMVWLGLHFFGDSTGEFGQTPHPLKVPILQLHGFVILPLLLSLGGILFGHVGRGWRYAMKRPSGLSAVCFFALLILTGYMLYYAGGELMREAATYVHWVLGACVPLIIIWHILIRIHRT